MNPILRNILAALAGLIVVFVVVSIGDMVPAWLSLVPESLIEADIDTIREHADEIPTSAHIIMVIGWGLAAFAGAYVSGRIASSAITVMVVITLALVTTILNLLLIPHPAWMWPVALILIGAGGFLGLRLSNIDSTPPSEPAG